MWLTLGENPVVIMVNTRALFNSDHMNKTEIKINMTQSTATFKRKMQKNEKKTDKENAWTGCLGAELMSNLDDRE